MASMEEQLREFLGSQASPTAQGGMVGAGVGALGALINGNQVSSGLSDLQSQYGQQADQLGQQMSQMPTLESMYGANSPYAAQLRQTLARKDAKAGRNSQYGPREAQYQAMLADKGSQYAAQQAQSMNAYTTARNQALQARQNANQQQAQVQAQQLSSLFGLANKTGLTGMANRGLQSLFGGGGGGGYTPDYSMPNMGFGGEQSSYGLDQHYTQPDNPYSIQTGQAPGLGGNFSGNTLMPDWSPQSYTPSYSATDMGTGGFNGEMPYQNY